MVSQLVLPSNGLGSASTMPGPSPYDFQSTAQGRLPHDSISIHGDFGDPYAHAH